MNEILFDKSAEVRRLAKPYNKNNTNTVTWTIIKCDIDVPMSSQEPSLRTKYRKLRPIRSQMIRISMNSLSVEICKILNIVNMK